MLMAQPGRGCAHTHIRGSSRLITLIPCLPLSHVGTPGRSRDQGRALMGILGLLPSRVPSGRTGPRWDPGPGPHTLRLPLGSWNKL